jgi:lycopene beta-cyclase
MEQFSYIAVLVFIFLTTLFLEIILKARVWQKINRLVLTIIPVVIAMTIWDWYAIANNHWFFNEELVTGIILFGFLPLEELLFFIFVPIAALLSFEAVRSIKKSQIASEDK